MFGERRITYTSSSRRPALWPRVGDYLQALRNRDGKPTGTCYFIAAARGPSPKGRFALTVLRCPATELDERESGRVLPMFWCARVRRRAR